MPEDPSDLISLETSRVPLLVTMTKIGPNYVVDVTDREEAAAVSSFVLAIDRDGEVVHSRKVGAGSLFVPPLKANWSVSAHHEPIRVRIVMTDVNYADVVCEDAGPEVAQRFRCDAHDSCGESVST